jgi:hypothetical protein
MSEARVMWTTMPPWVPLSPSAASATVRACVPAAFKVIVKEWLPLSAAVKV